MNIKKQNYHGIIAAWLGIVVVAIVMMALIGAVTRLTESGLSMVEWRALIDVLPPLDEAAWQGEFDLYRQTPEYIHKNYGMSLDEFKNIYFWEWFHRLWGRLIGLLYGLPFLWFMARGAIPRHKYGALGGLLLLGGAQGFVGWFMVKSGLVDVPAVSHYRLALHLGMAFLLAVMVYWQARWFHHHRLVQQQDSVLPAQPLGKLFGFASAVMVATMVWGAFVAGKDAGMIYNEFPLMGGRLIPAEAWFHAPWWLNLTENHATIQWLHRCLGMASVGMAIALWAQKSKDTQPAAIRQAAWAVMIALVLQMGLGIATLVSQVMIPLAAMHQGGALVVLLLMTELAFRHRYPR